MHTTTLSLRLLPAIFLLAAPALAQVQPASVFSDHMVLQRNKPIAVWGTATAGEKVTLTLDTLTATATADQDGRWLAHLDAHAAGGPFTLQLEGKNKVTINDVLLGDVWVCSGQSNMSWTVERHKDSLAAVTDAKDVQLRLLTVPRAANAKPQLSTKAKWQTASPETLRKFSAVAYGFGRHLRQHVNVPIGLVHNSWGGTRAEAWTREAMLKKHDVLEPILSRWDVTYKRYPRAKKRFDEALSQWQAKAKLARAAGKKPPRKPGPPLGPDHRHAPARLFHGMVTPLLPMSIRGVIWYQGEANALRAYQYRTLFPALIRDWRDAFGQGQLPFLFVQLASFGAKTTHPHTWPELREAQTMTLDLPNTGMACTIDLGLEKNIHPPHKLEVGRRLALWALAGTYGQDVVPSGPLYAHHTIEGDQVRISFEHVGKGLTCKGDTLTGFEIATADGKFLPATAKIDGDTVVVSHPGMKAPRHVRYAWLNWPAYSLFNADGLPASSFRTDQRTGVTAEAR